MKKNIFILLFLALYLNTVLAQGLPIKIFSVNYSGDTTLLLDGETTPFESENIVAFLLSVRENSEEINPNNKDSLLFSNLTVVFSGTNTTFFSTFFQTESTGLVDLEEGPSENDFSLFLEVLITKEFENNLVKNIPLFTSDLKDQEVLTEEIAIIRTLFNKIARKRILLDLIFEKQ